MARKVNLLLFVFIIVFPTYFLNCSNETTCQDGATQSCECAEQKGTQICSKDGVWGQCNCQHSDEKQIDASEIIPTENNQPDSIILDIVDELSHDELSHDVSKEESSPEKNTIKEHSLRFCPAKCQKDSDCAVKPCGSRTKCLSTISKCVDPNIICPDSCQKDSDCSSRQGCLSKTMCYRSNPTKTKGTCELPASGSTCPSKCKSSFDCLMKACQKKRFCNTTKGECVEGSAALCPSKCTFDTDCPSSKCGIKTSCKNGKCETSCPTHCTKDSQCSPCLSICYFHNPAAESGICRPPNPAKVCPTTCKTTYDCFTTACGKKRFCNATTTHTCVAETAVCPKQCKTDTDCQKVSGCSKNACFFATKTGYCIPLKISQTCPSRCRTNMDCFVSGCKKKRTCNRTTKRCTL